jgi:hypothetical protein
MERCCSVGVGFVASRSSLVFGLAILTIFPVFTDIVVESCAICRNHIMDLCA